MQDWLGRLLREHRELSEEAQNPMTNVIGRQLGSVVLCLQNFLRPILGRCSIRYSHFWNEIIVNTEGRNLRFSQLSDGTKAMLSLCADLAHRMARLNPHLGAPLLQTPGVVLIDELDMHLHPEWQQHVLKDLRQQFPERAGHRCFP